MDDDELLSEEIDYEEEEEEEEGDTNEEDETEEEEGTEEEGTEEEGTEAAPLTASGITTLLQTMAPLTPLPPMTPIAIQTPGPDVGTIPPIQATSPTVVTTQVTSPAFTGTPIPEPRVTSPIPLPPITVPDGVLPLVSPPPVVVPVTATAPPIQPIKLVSPSTVCLKGKKHQWGVSLEKAPEDIVYIGRSFNMGGWRLPKSKWNNTYSVKKYGRDKAIELYRAYILNTPHLVNVLPELSGKTLACWCAPDPCHGDVLVQLFNQRLLGITTPAVPVLPMTTQPVAPAIPADPTMPTGAEAALPLGGLPPISVLAPQPTTTVPPPALVIRIPPAPVTPVPAPPALVTPLPPIPPAMTRPAPATLVIQKPAPVVTIQPTSPTAISTVVTGGVLPPPTQPQLVVTQPVAVHPVVKPAANLDSLLAKSETENNDMFNMRNAYSRAAMKIFNNQINPATAVLIGRMAANEATFGITYPEDSDRVLRYIDIQIVANPALYTVQEVVSPVPSPRTTANATQYTFVLSTTAKEELRGGRDPFDDNWDTHTSRTYEARELTGYDIPLQHNGSRGSYFSTWDIKSTDLNTYPAFVNLVKGGNDIIIDGPRYITELYVEK